MQTRRIAVPALLAMAACAVPASANAAVISVDKRCYGDSDPIRFDGNGFTPGGAAAITNNAGMTRSGAPRIGNFVLRAPTGTVGGFLLPQTATPTRIQRVTFTATDTLNTANVTAVNTIRARLGVTVSPRNASPRRVRRFRAFGFTSGSTLYRHIVRGKRVSNGRMAGLKGVCRETSVRKRLFRRSAKSGTYRVQFDTKRGYSSRTVQRVRFRVRVFRTVRNAISASAAGTGEVWARLP